MSDNKPVYINPNHAGLYEGTLGELSISVDDVSGDVLNINIGDDQVIHAERRVGKYGPYFLAKELGGNTYFITAGENQYGSFLKFKQAAERGTTQERQSFGGREATS